MKPQYTNTSYVYTMNARPGLVKEDYVRRTLALAIAVTAALVMGGAAAATAGVQPTSTTATTSNAGIPALVNPATDLAPHSPGPEQSFNDSAYFTSLIKANGHSYGVLVHTILFPNMDKRLLTLALTDITAGTHQVLDTEVAASDYTWGPTGIDIHTPNVSWTGDAQTMSVQATAPWGSLQFTLRAQGPALEYAGSGYSPVFGAPSHEFALPAMATSGTLTIAGVPHPVSGTTWMDRQWFSVDQLYTDPAMRWTWMNLSLPNGDKIAIWDAISSATENAWATVLHPDGSYDVTAVTPLATGASGYWTSPVSGAIYPTCWQVTIPSLNTRLKVNLTGTDDQEIVNSLIGPRLEGTAAFTGTYQGKSVTGQNYVEMVGHWPGT